MDADKPRRPPIGPAEFAALVKVYNAVIAQSGISSAEVEEIMLRRYIIKKFRGGMTDTDVLLAHCLEIARQLIKA